MQNLLITIAGKLRSGQFAAAAKLARTGHKKHPRNPDFLKFSGIAYHELQKHSEAIKGLSKALKLNPSDPDTRRYLVASLIAIGQPVKAASALRVWLKTTPEDAELYYLLAGAQLKTDNFLDAIDALNRALGLRPELTKARVMRGFCFFENRDFRAALADFQDARSVEPDNTEILLNLGSVLNQLHRYDESRDVFQHAVKISPRDIELRKSLAGLLTQLGFFDAAKLHYKAILNLDPTHTDALFNLAETASPKEIQPMKVMLQNALRQKAVTGSDRTTLMMALGTLTMRDGETDQAMTHIRSSNALRAKILPYDADAATANFAAIKSQFPPGTKFDAPDAQAPAMSPIFVLGLPRSGTTLTEMILSAHSNVVGLGEYGLMQASVSRDRYVGSVFAEQHATDFLAGLPDLPEATQSVVDKTPGNYRLIGYIAQAFPNARFINVVRDPREVAFSMWTLHFIGESTYYTSDMEWIAHAANLYQRYMSHWKSLLPDRILSVSYLDMVSDVQLSSQTLANFCNLEWQLSMAHPERNANAIKTASIHQVRAGVHQKSLGKWREFSELLEPLIQKLDPELWPDLHLSDD